MKLDETYGRDRSPIPQDEYYRMIAIYQQQYAAQPRVVVSAKQK